MILITPENYPLSEIKVFLGNQEYLLTLDFSERKGIFIISLATIDGAEIFSGRYAINGEDLLATCNTIGRPAGKLFVAKLAANVNWNPGIGDWGVSHFLAYDEEI